MNENLHVVCPHCHSTNRIPKTRLNQDAKCGHCKDVLLIEKAVQLDAQSFERHVTRSQLPVVVDFWAPWCGPCRSMAPAFEEAADRLVGLAQLAKLDTEAHPQAAAPYHIRSIPTMVVFVEGKEMARVSGAMSAGQIEQWVKSVL